MLSLLIIKQILLNPILLRIRIWFDDILLLIVLFICKQLESLFVPIGQGMRFFLLSGSDISLLGFPFSFGGCYTISWPLMMYCARGNFTRFLYASMVEFLKLLINYLLIAFGIIFCILLVLAYRFFVLQCFASSLAVMCPFS